MAGRKNIQNTLTHLPSVQKVLDRLAQLAPPIKSAILTTLVRQELSELRLAIRTGNFIPPENNDLIEAVAEKVVARVNALTKGQLKKVINATGIVLHTGLGRAPFGNEILLKMAELLSGYVNLEFDLDTGERGERLDITNEKICLLTGAESSAVVNNNAAAVWLALNSLADGREVIVSRGELIEIGGSFRLPDIMAKSGARMVEVGTTNRTYLQDYQKARTRKTGAILLAHSSNYRIEGFTTKPTTSEITNWAHSQNLSVIFDLGSGALFPMENVELPYEPVVAETIKQGFDLVTFSGDKLLGGPQAGIIVGREKYISRLRQNPLMRILRCDKTTFYLLDYILGQYLLDKPFPEIETYRLLTTKPAQLKAKAIQILNSIEPEIIKVLGLTVREIPTEAGSGAMPTAQIPSVAIVAIPQHISEAQLAQKFRSYAPPIIGYCQNGEFRLDLKAVQPDDLPIIQSALQAIGRSLLS
ncbi:MAG TPA: L-seryl-tRNA(Sec) selenium transferase [Candidatus Marinimicrobia bacterium]|nr:L-seryl-tRNA(Sec) selenium transferase [Candidatus Neomarinimicrobiota bacterium]